LTSAAASRCCGAERSGADFVEQTGLFGQGRDGAAQIIGSLRKTAARRWMPLLTRQPGGIVDAVHDQIEKS
jgi:hypothetical protein